MIWLVFLICFIDGEFQSKIGGKGRFFLARDEDVAYVVGLNMIKLEMTILEGWGNTYNINDGGK